MKRLALGPVDGPQSSAIPMEYDLAEPQSPTSGEAMLNVPAIPSHAGHTFPPPLPPVAINIGDYAWSLFDDILDSGSKTTPRDDDDLMIDVGTSSGRGLYSITSFSTCAGDRGNEQDLFVEDIAGEERDDDDNSDGSVKRKLPSSSISTVDSSSDEKHVPSVFTARAGKGSNKRSKQLRKPNDDDPVRRWLIAYAQTVINQRKTELKNAEAAEGNSSSSSGATNSSSSSNGNNAVADAEATKKKPSKSKKAADSAGSRNAKGKSDVVDPLQYFRLVAAAINLGSVAELTHHIHRLFAANCVLRSSPVQVILCENCFNSQD
jgi:hypothetical protein